MMFPRFLSYFLILVKASVSGAVPGMGMSLGSSGVPVPTTSPQKAVAAHGPRHPRIFRHKFSEEIVLFCFVSVWFYVWCFGFVLDCREKMLHCLHIGPSSSGPC